MFFTNKKNTVLIKIITVTNFSQKFLFFLWKILVVRIDKYITTKKKKELTNI